MTVTLATQFSETGQTEPWKNDVAHQLNLLLGVNTSFPFERAAIISLVQRVADFEEITVLKSEE